MLKVEKWLSTQEQVLGALPEDLSAVPGTHTEWFTTGF